MARDEFGSLASFFVSFDAGKILRAGVDPGFFLGRSVPLRNGITKNIDTKKAFD